MEGISKSQVSDVTETLDKALAASGCAEARVRHRPRPLSDNGLCYIAGELAQWLDRQDMDQVRGAPSQAY